MAVILDAEQARLSTAKLMAYRLRVGGFAQGRGGQRVPDFTADTVPTLEDATDVTTRNAALVSNDFPGADEGDEPELRTIAALRSAIQLEASAPNMDAERIRVWRDELRESVGRFGGGRSGAGGTQGDAILRDLTPRWDFGPDDPPRAPGSEQAWPETVWEAVGGTGSATGRISRRLRW